VGEPKRAYNEIQRFQVEVLLSHAGVMASGIANLPIHVCNTTKLRGPGIRKKYKQKGTISNYISRLAFRFWLGVW